MNIITKVILGPLTLAAVLGIASSPLGGPIGTYLKNELLSWQAILAVTMMVGGYFFVTMKDKPQRETRVNDRSCDPETKNTEGRPAKNKPGEVKRIGTYINVFKWNLFYRPLLSLIAGTIVSLILLFIDWFFELTMIDAGIFSNITFALTLFFALSDEKDEIVPESHGAMITLWGKRFKFFRKEGIYSWTGRRFGLRRSETKHVVGIDLNGFIKLEQIPVSIWNQSDEKDKILLEALGSDNSTVSTTLTNTIIIADPMLWLNSSDPIKDFADQSREAFRKAISFFLSTDCPQLKNVFSALMQGESILTIFLPKTTENHELGSIIRSRGGMPLYEIIPRLATKEEIDEKTTTFLEKVITEADPDMYEACLINGTLHARIRTVESSFSDMLRRLGVKLIKTAVGDVRLSKEVTDAANAAASEQLQRKAQIASAKTLRKATKIINEAREDSSELVLGLAASQDNKRVRIVVTGGGSNNPLKDAAILHATLGTTEGDE